MPLPRGSEPKSTGQSLQYILHHNLPQNSGWLHFQTHQYIQIVDRMSRFFSPLWWFFLQRKHDPLYPHDLPITPISYGESPRSSSRFPWRCLDPNRWWTSLNKLETIHQKIWQQQKHPPNQQPKNSKRSRCLHSLLDLLHHGHMHVLVDDGRLCRCQSHHLEMILNGLV